MASFVVAASASHYTTLSVYTGLERWLGSDAGTVLISIEVWEAGSCSTSEEHRLVEARGRRQ